jgi:plastocyanin
LVSLLKHGKLLLPTAIALVLVMISSAGAAPPINLPSFANYHLGASTTNVQDCGSANVTIAAFVCSNQSSGLVTINDDGQCTFSNDTSCFFTPSSITITAGMSVSWHNSGNLYHNIASNSTSNVGLPSFSGSVYQGSYFSQQFFLVGTYHYYDPFHTGMKGTVIVTQATVPPPVVASFGADGSLGWNVAGLDQNDALLGVNHSIKVYDQTATPQALVYNESGIFEQSINLGTREESPSTIGLLQSLPFGLSLYGFNNGFGYGPGVYGYPGPYGYYPGPFNNFQSVRTLWWVNGPLVNGSVVELLTGYASVTAGKSIPLSSGLGTQDAWTITSVYAQNSNQAQPQSLNNFNYCPFPFAYFGGPQPQPQCFISKSNVSVSLSADYGQHSDLLFGLSATISTLTQTTTDYPAGSTVYGFNNNGFGSNGIPIASPVSIISTMTSSLTFTLSLSNTNLDLSKRMVLQPAQSTGSTGSTSSGGNGATPSQTSNQPFSMSMVYFIAGAGTAALLGGAMWAIFRNRRKATLSAAPLVPVTPA